MSKCKWAQGDFGEICVNADCPMCADFCPVLVEPNVCKWEDRGGFETFREILGNPYSEIPEIVDAWCAKNWYDDMLVTVAADGEIKTEYLICNFNIPGGWEWERDWWEGAKDVRLIGFRPISMVRVYGEPTVKQEGHEVIE